MSPASPSVRSATLRCSFCQTLNRIDLARAADRPKCGSCERPILLDRPLKLTDDDLDRMVRDSEVPVLVDFYADWCGPCKIMAPFLDELARERIGEVLVAKLDTDANPGVSERFGIRGIPTLILFKNGNEAGRAVGAIPREQLSTFVDTGSLATNPNGGNEA